MNDQLQKMLQNQLKNRSPQQIKIIAIAFVVLAVIGGIGWGLVSGPLKSFLGERGLKLDSNSGFGVSFDQEKMWPNNMPGDVPRIEEGGISRQSYDKDKNVWNVSFSNLPQEVGENYASRLETGGWTITRDTRNEEAQTMMIYAEKGQLLLNYSQNFNVGSGLLKVEKQPLYKVQ